MTKINDSTVARVAGNIMAGMLPSVEWYDEVTLAKVAVKLARAIVAEVERTAPSQKEEAAGYPHD